MSTQTSQIFSSVVARGLCTGCGVCAVICPSDSLTMRLNENGEFVPVLGEGCTECNLCSSVCPQLDENSVDANAPNLICSSSEAVLGDCEKLSTLAGYASDPERRLKSASGGILTLVLKYLLDSHKIDAAIVVGPANPDDGLLFKAKLVRTAEDIDMCVGSKYYPIELSRALCELKSTKERVAVVGLPCHVNATRALMCHSKPFGKQIRYIFGLVCGHGVSTHFTDLLITATGISSNSIDRVAYRGKQGSKTSSDFIFSAYKKDHLIGKPISFNSSPYGAAWCCRLFVQRACDFCTDCFAEEADASFMDAWLPEYIKNPGGTSLIVSRTSKVTEILNELYKTGLANLWEVSPADVIRSQTGVIRYKRELLPDRVFSAISRGKAVPARFTNCGIKGTFAQRRENARYERNRQISRFLWRLNLPVWVRMRMIMLLTGPGIIKRSKLLIIKILGQRGKIIIKSVLERIKLFKRIK